MLARQIAFALAGFLALIPAAAHAAPNPVVVPDPVAPPIDGDGTGLCVASAISTAPTNDFGLFNPGNYNGNINSFIEGHKADRVEYVIRTLLDLSNNNSSGLKLSYGDFTDSMLPTCQIGGCDFFVNNDTTSFGSRIRGFLNVTSDMAGKPIHFGIYADDAVSLTFFGKNNGIYPVITRPAEIGFPTWRTTNTVTFDKPGIYPLEVLYIEIGEHAALEMSYFEGTFTDFELPANQTPITNLKNVGFTLFQPTQFFQTLSGNPSFPDVNQCQQCDRQFVNLPGNNGCNAGYYCNEAALCAPCDTAIFCGPSCSPCGGDTPYCINVNGQNQCGQCREDKDCKAGFTCDLATHTCNECNENKDCPRGEICVDHSCVTCATSDACAGSSCNCCPKGVNGQQMQCSPVEKDGSPICVECTTNTDCASGVCDVLVGQCVPELYPNERPDCCGDDCLKCPSDYPFCLPGPISTACAQCRSDMDCKDGQYCQSGNCLSCTRDRHCGVRCESCGGDTPYCLDGQTADRSSCVRCTDDAQCNGGACDPMTHECMPTCSMSCAPDTPYCDGQNFVECYADTQCPCNGTCDLSTNTCSSSCRNNTDCLGNQHCRWNESGNAKECALGPMPGETACGGTLASACEGSIGSKGDDPTPAGGIVALSIMALLGRRRRRGKQ